MARSKNVQVIMDAIRDEMQRKETRGHKRISAAIARAVMVRLGSSHSIGKIQGQISHLATAGFINKEKSRCPSCDCQTVYYFGWDKTPEEYETFRRGSDKATGRSRWYAPDASYA